MEGKELTIAEVVEALVSSKDKYVEGVEKQIADAEITMNADGTTDKTKMELVDTVQKLQSDMRFLLVDKDKVQPYLEKQEKRKQEFAEKEKEDLAEFIKTLK
jgi:uncharacterized lipoprotein NlpE involved in copper resistance